MSLNWQWKGVVGEIINEGKNYKTFIYEGNALLIFINETKDEYALHTFFVDKRHAENCLGLHPKEYDGCKEQFKGMHYILSAKSKNCMEFAKLLAKAKIPCKIEIVENYESEVHKEFHNNYNFKNS